jgi:hypothetical protein
MTKFGVSIFAALLLTGCSIVDTGEIDYRRAEQPINQEQKVAAYVANKCPPQFRADLMSGNPARFDGAKEKACLPLLEGRLFRKNTSMPGSRIQPKDIYSIRLEHGLVSFMSEPGFDPTRLFYDPKRVKRQVGEIVILANVFEFGEGDADQRFSDLTDLSQVKVIYYSPDVEARQDLNFSNIPLKAPAEYKGRPIGIQLIVLELDRMSSQMQSLLKTLAGLGQQSNLAPGGPMSSLLLNLGTSMLTQNNDDTIFEYRFVLDPSDGSLSSQSAPFEAGRYVIKRTHDRDRDQIWRNLVIDHNTGRLMLLASDKDDAAIVPPTPYTADTYFTLNVIKHPTGTSPGGYGFRTLDELGKDIEAASSRRDAPFADVQTVLGNKLVDMRRTSRVADLLPAWKTASTRFRDYGRALQPGDGCKTVLGYDTRLSELNYEATRAAVDFHRLYREAISEKDAAGAPIFQDEHKLSLLSALAPYFIPETPSSVQISELTNPAAFDAAYASSADSRALVAAMKIMAEGPWRAKSCDDLIAAQLATP